MSVGFFTDLDGTLLYSTRRLPAAGPSVVAVEHHGTQPASWMTEHAAALLRTFRERHHLIPTTTRVRRQYDKVALPGGLASVAIIANGLQVLRDGVADADWTAQITDPSWAIAPEREVHRMMLDVAADAHWLWGLRVEDGVGSLSARRGSRMPAQALRQLRLLLDGTGYRVWSHGRKTFVIPAHATKEAAAGFVAAQLGLTVTLAAGDTSMDHGLLAWADHSIQPAHSEDGSETVKTASSGVRASEQILEWATSLVA